MTSALATIPGVDLSTLMCGAMGECFEIALRIALAAWVTFAVLGVAVHFARREGREQ
jgi:hypothetical protein